MELTTKITARLMDAQTQLDLATFIEIYKNNTIIQADRGIPLFVKFDRDYQRNLLTLLNSIHYEDAQKLMNYINKHF